MRGARQPVRPARLAVTAIFTLNGFAIGSWGARVPAIQDHVGVGPGGLAVPLAGLAAGALLAMPIAGRAASRRGSRATVTAGVVAVGLTLPLPAIVPGLALVALAAFAFGAANGTLDVSMNVQGVAVERALGRPVLSSLHAGFSLGALLGAGAGALAAATGLRAAAQFAAAGAVVIVAGLWCTRLLIEDRPAAANRRPPPRAGRWALRGLAFCCLFAEGAAADWSAVHLRSIGAAASVAALAYAGFSLAMAAGRLTGDALTRHWGPVALARRGGVLGAAALGVALTSGAPGIALAAYVALGAGLAVIIPLVFRAAAAGADAGPALAGVTTTGYLGFLAGPPLIGAVAAATSLTGGLLLVVAATATVAAGAGALAPRPPAPKEEARPHLPGASRDEAVAQSPSSRA